jgi:hypothetical protein
MRTLRRSTWILTSSVLLFAGAAVVTLRAAEPAPARAAAQPVAPKPTLPKAAVPAPGTSPVPEESATIRDDPTIAPDPKQSADNDISFPADT